MSYYYHIFLNATNGQIRQLLYKKTFKETAAEMGKEAGGGGRHRVALDRTKSEWTRMLKKKKKKN